MLKEGRKEGRKGYECSRLWRKGKNEMDGERITVSFLYPALSLNLFLLKKTHLTFKISQNTPHQTYNSNIIKLFSIV